MRVTKTQGRAPIAEGTMHRAWSKANGVESYTMSIRCEDTPTGQARWVTVKLSHAEAINFASYVTEREAAQ